MLELIENNKSATVGELKTTLDKLEQDGIEPDQWWNLRANFPYKITIDWSSSGAIDCYDIIFQHHNSPAINSPSISPPEIKPWKAYANDPLLAEVEHKLESELRQHLQSQLPHYMVSSALVALDEMPLTPNGKINRRALPAPGKSRPELATELVIPQSELEQAIAEIWQEVLQLDVVGVNDSFFELGGNSLLLTQVHHKIATTLKPEISIVTLFQYPTIQKLAEHLSEPQASTTAEVPQQQTKSRQEESDIAIIGISCRFPGANNLEQFWQNLRDGVESISVLKDTELAIRDRTVLKDPNYVKAGANLPDVDLFDASFFGYSAPSIEGQTAVIREALNKAEVDASSISYVEAHGTGTALGDPIEIAALTQAFGQTNNNSDSCALGSVKTNIGHLVEAAGMAGLIKTVLALKYKQIPPTLHFQKPNPNINFTKSPFFVNTELTEWERNGTPRRAGVSSFGMGGTNAHVVLEESPLAPLIKGGKSEDRSQHILTLSAKSDRALRELAENYVSYLASEPEAELADICYTANAGHQHFEHRLAVVAASKPELQEQLADFELLNTGIVQQPTSATIAFLFTGQGSQYINMGRQLYEQEPTFKATIDRCTAILEPELEQPLLTVLYPESNTDENGTMDETAYTQPALFAIEYALAQLWISWGIKPDVVMGHSVGEYVAACLAGVFSLENGLKLIAARGRLMQALPQDGAMLSMLASEQQAIAIIQPYGQEVSIAAINGAQSVVISGKKAAIAEINQNLVAKGVKTKLLRVSHAFHSHLMEPMLADFELVAQEINFSQPQIKLISNVTGAIVTQEVTTAQYWCRHIRQAVRFADSMSCLNSLDVDILIEVGAKPILLGMGRHCFTEHHGLWLPSLRSDHDDWEQILTSLAELYVRGITIDWVGFDRNYERYRTPLPTYPFQRERYWVEAPDWYRNGLLTQANENGKQSERKSLEKPKSEQLSSKPENLTIRQKLAQTQAGDQKNLFSTHICSLVAKTLGVNYPR